MRNEDHSLILARRATRGDEGSSYFVTVARDEKDASLFCGGFFVGVCISCECFDLGRGSSSAMPGRRREGLRRRDLSFTERGA